MARRWLAAGRASRIGDDMDQSNAHGLRPDDVRRARASAERFSLRRTPEPDLLAELDLRFDLAARYQADLDAGDFSDGDAGQLRGGIAFQRHHIERIVGELEAREAARTIGFRPATGGAEADLPARFATARGIDCAEVVRAETGQPGRRSGDRWVFPCPFHRDDTPSLTAYPGERGWYCFSCQRGGDAVAFLAELRSIGAVEALRLLEAGALDSWVPA